MREHMTCCSAVVYRLGAAVPAPVSAGTPFRGREGHLSPLEVRWPQAGLLLVTGALFVDDRRFVE
jgi:hypothetical protein